MPSYYLRYFYAHDAVLAEQLDGDAAGAGGGGDRARAARDLPRPGAGRRSRRCSSSAAARSTARRRSALVALARVRRRRGARGRRRATAARSPGSPTTTSSRCRRASAAAGPSRSPQPPLAPELLGLVQHVAAYERLAVRARAARGEPADVRKALLAHPLIGQWEPTSARAALLRSRHCRSRRSRCVSERRARRRRRQLEDRPRAASRDDGAVLALVARPAELAAPPRARRLRSTLLERAARRGRGGGRRRTAGARDVAQLLLAGVDFPAEEERCTSAVDAARLGDATSRVGNDTFAVLRAGTERGWGVAVVCGAGINCVGVAPGRAPRALPRARRDHRRLGRRLRRRPRRARPRPRAARTAAARGRPLERRVPAHFGLRHAARARRGDPPRARSRSGGSIELAPVVLRGGGGRPGRRRDRRPARRARSSRWRASRSSGSTSLGEPVEVLLGGGLLRAGDAPLLERIDAACAGRRRRSAVRATDSPPIVGAALLALDELGADAEAQARAARASSVPRSTGSRSRGWSPMAEVRFEQATRIYPGTDAPAVDALDLAIADGELMVLVGPSGSGKTTALRMLAGLEEVDAGAIYIGDRDVTDVPPKRATSRWCSRTTRSTRTSPSPRTSASRSRSRGSRRPSASARVREVAEMLGLDAVPRAQARPALRRPAPARRDGPRDRPQAERLPDGRAALEPRREAARADARRHRRAAGALGVDDGLRHARPGRGDDARAPRRRAARRAAAAVRRRRASCTTGR